MVEKIAAFTSRVERAGRRLTRLERRVLVLSARDNLPNVAIAARLGISPARVERLLARAIVGLGRGLARGDRR